MKKHNFIFALLLLSSMTPVDKAWGIKLVLEYDGQTITLGDEHRDRNGQREYWEDGALIMISKCKSSSSCKQTLTNNDGSTQVDIYQNSKHILQNSEKTDGTKESITYLDNQLEASHVIEKTDGTKETWEYESTGGNGSLLTMHGKTDSNGTTKETWEYDGWDKRIYSIYSDDQLVERKSEGEFGDGFETISYEKYENGQLVEKGYPAEDAIFIDDSCACGNPVYASNVVEKYENGQITEEKKYEWDENAYEEHLTSETKYENGEEVTRQEWTYENGNITSEAKYENGDKIETIYNYGEADYYCDNYIDEGWSECWEDEGGALLSTQTYKNGQLIGDVSYGISEYCPEEGDCFDIWAIKSTNNYAQDTNIKEYNPADGSYTIKDENGNIIGFEGKRIFTIDEANQVAGKVNSVKIRYR